MELVKLARKALARSSGIVGIFLVITSPVAWAQEAPADAPAEGFVVLEGGGFPMGSTERKNEQPVHFVAIRRFAMGAREVTFEEYDTFCEATGRKKPDDAGWGRGSRPVINVNWEDANAYAAWLSENTGRRFRLPTEAEWEYAARVGGASQFGFELPVTTDKANYDGNFSWKEGPKGEYRRKTLPVGSFAPNAWGLFDLHGNVQEWVVDCYHGDYAGAPANGAAWVEKRCKRRVVRGGSWQYPPAFMRASYRIGLKPDGRSASVGFRLVQELESAPDKPGRASPWKPADISHDSRCEGKCVEKLRPVAIGIDHLAGITLYARPDVNDAVAQLGDCLESIKQCVAARGDPTQTAACVAASQCPAVCKQAYAAQFSATLPAAEQLDGLDRIFLDKDAVCAPVGRDR